MNKGMEKTISFGTDLSFMMILMGFKKLYRIKEVKEFECGVLRKKSA